MWIQVAVSGFLFAVVLCGSAHAGPKLALDPKTYEWGRQKENKELYEFTFTVKNEGDETLEITNVRPGCGCTKVDLKAKTLAPGEATQMTGSLKTKGVEGHMRKGIILTSNDPTHKTSIASLDIRFPYSGEGLRSKYSSYGARLRRGMLWVYAYVENCEPETPITVQAMELPEGWDCADKLPLTVPPESKQTFRLTKAVGEVEPEPFADLAFRILTDFDKTPHIDGTIRYSPKSTSATTVSKAVRAGPTAKKGPVVRWPMTTPLESKEKSH